MCGRYTLAIPSIVVENRFQVILDKDSYRERFNAAPGQPLPVITNLEPGKLQYFRWGLIPHWAKDPKTGYRLINARAESILQKPSFRSPMQHYRCLVPADSYYEWQQSPAGKTPFRILMQDETAFAMAGLWSVWKDAEGRPVQTFTIITLAANGLVHEIHDRMPAILLKEKEHIWLDPNLSAKEATNLLQPYPANEMKAYPVSDRVNKAINDDRELLNAIR